MYDISYFQILSNAVTHSSKVTLRNIMKGPVKVTFPTHLQYLIGSVSKSLSSLKVYCRPVLGFLSVFIKVWLKSAQHPPTRYKWLGAKLYRTAYGFLICTLLCHTDSKVIVL